MSRDVTVKATFAGDSKSLEKTLDNVGRGAKDMAKDLGDAEKKAHSFGGALDSAGGAADASESKFMGTADLLDGLGGAFGLPTEGATNMMRSFGDLSGGFATLQPLIGTVGTALKTGLGGAMSFIAAHPLIFALMALVAIFVVLWTHSETFRDIVKGAFETVGNVIQGVFDWVKDHWPLLLAILTGPIGIAVGLIVSHWDTIKNAFTKVKEWIGQRVDDIVGFVTGIGGRIAGAVSTMFDGIKEAFTAVKDWLWERLKDVVGFYAGMYGRIAAVAMGMFDGIKDAFKTALNWIIEKWNSLEFSIPGFKVGPVGFEGFTLGVPDIPKFHAGGIVPGPAGAQVPIMALAGERVLPTGAAGAGPLVIQLVLDGRVVTEVVHDGLLAKQRRTPLGLAT